jgi:hypothetical protein
MTCCATAQTQGEWGYYGDLEEYERGQMTEAELVVFRQRASQLSVSPQVAAVAAVAAAAAAAPPPPPPHCECNISTCSSQRANSTSSRRYLLNLIHQLDARHTDRPSAPRHVRWIAN